MAQPDFIIIGAMKCGTTTLAAQLGAQPGIWMSTPKEPNYFSDDAVFARGPAWYASLFEGAAPGQLTGEASTHYTKLPTYPDTLDRLASAAPEARLVYMLRNPLDRLISHYIHDWSQGVISSDLDAALETHPELVEYGCYGAQIAPFVARFSASRILLTSLEQMKADPGGELARVAAHVGLKSSVKWQEDLAQQNASAKRVRKLPMQKLLIDNPVATGLRRTLIPKSLRTRVRQARTMTHRPTLSEAQKRSLIRHFMTDHETLAAQYPGAAVLRLCYPFAIDA